MDESALQYLRHIMASQEPTGTVVCAPAYGPFRFMPDIMFIDPIKFLQKDIR